MNFLNKIGQRNAAKYLVFISLFSSFLFFVIRFAISSESETLSSFIAAIIGIGLFSLPNLVLFKIANFAKESRLMAVFCSFVATVMNSLLFLVSIFAPQLANFLFVVVLFEVAATVIFYFSAKKSNVSRKKTIRGKAV